MRKISPMAKAVNGGRRTIPASVPHIAAAFRAWPLGSPYPRASPPGRRTRT